MDRVNPDVLVAERVGKPILFSTDGIEEDMADDKVALAAADVPVFETPERAADAAAVLARYAEIQAKGADPEVVVDD
jgi:acetyltransferase